MTIEENWEEFLADTGVGIEGEAARRNAKALYFAAFSRGWAAAIARLQECQDPMVAEMQALQATMGRAQ
jgi:hypothetical protein